ncbi:HET-domain-containing protein [Coniochaeta sp. PMI_546]|nr:HET-domain-containing protein [Coniochaeta sp. PMI_546]
MSFNYSSVRLPFNSIRLLTLYPSTSADGSRPTCSLEAFDLDEAPPFTALSYAWGDASRRKVVQVNGKELSITSALDSALRHLRLPNQGRKLWIDQICINQADEDEKASQVLLMRQIYSQAETTIAWLGEERDGSHKAIRLIQDAGREALSIGLRDVPRDDYASLRWHITAAFSNLSNRELEVAAGDPLGKKKIDLCRLIDSKYSKQWDETLDQLYRLFSRPYFRRGWIKQEVVIPKTLIFQCGLQTVGGDEFVSFVRLDSFIQVAKRQRWTAILRAMQRQDKDATNRMDASSVMARAERLNATVAKAQIINSERFNNRFGLGQTVGIRSRFHMGGHLQEEMTLAFMIKTFVSDLEFTDPRDRVFGLLGMASDTDALEIQVDYAITWEEVYANAVKRMIQNGNIDILCDVCSPSSSSRLPSWVPNLNAAKVGFIREYTYMSGKPFCAGGKFLAHHRVSDEDQFSSPGTLLLRGVVVDTILSTGPRWNPDSSGSYFSNNLRSFKDVIFKLYEFSKLSKNEYSRNLPANHPVLAIAHRRDDDAGLRTAIMDHESIDSSGRRRRATRERMYAAVENLARGTPGVHGKELQDFLNHAQILQHYAPFFGQRGFIGLCSPKVKQGDVVCVMYGANVPLVLRPAGPLRGPYRLVGEAYCDTIMDGEALRIGLAEKTFQLV